MEFSRVYSTDNLQNATVVMTTYAYSISYKYQSVTLTSTNDTSYTLASKVGSSSSFLGVASKKYRPGVFSIHPAVRNTVTASGQGTGAEIPFVMWGKTYVHRRIIGCLALVVETSFPSFVPAAVPAASSYTNVQLDAKAKAKASEAALMTTLAEAPETLAMLENPRSKLEKLCKRLRPPRTLRLVGNALDYASSAWLQYRYGIMPLVYEVDTYRNLYTRKISGVYMIDKGVSMDVSSPVETSRELNGNTALNIYFKGSENYSKSTRVVSTVYTRRQLSMLARLGIDASGIALAVWERIPYSFIVDWFVDVGGWMRAALPSPYVITLGQTLSERTEEVMRINTRTARAMSTVSTQYPEVPCYSDYMVHRVAYARNTIPTLDLTGSMIWGVNTLKRQIDALALGYGNIYSNLPKLVSKRK